MIEIKNTTKYRVNGEFLKKVSKTVLLGEKAKIDISIVLLGEKAIQRLNNKYRKKNKPTDVLSFRYNNTGEIVLCPSQIKKDTLRSKTGFKRSVALVLIHGILHTLGYDHEKFDKEAKKMNLKQEFYLKKILQN